MVESILANLGILLLMHLVINTVYHLHQQKKLTQKLVEILHIFIVAFSIISMFYYPIKIDGYSFHLGLIPIIFISLFHGWKLTVPVFILVSLFQLMLYGVGTIFELTLGIMVPAIIAMLFYPLKIDKLKYVKPFLIMTVCWLISNLPIFTDFDHGLFLLGKVILLRYLSFSLASFIMYFFIYRGISHLEIVKKLQFYAEHDPLTTLYNMRKFEEIVRLHANDHKRMFMAMIDIDRFKLINDTFGHQAGDQAIQTISKIILTFCSKHFYAGRYGGDEFIVFILADSFKEATQVLDGLRIAVSETTITPIDSKQRCSLSLSIGISPLLDPFHLKTSIERADQQLYFAKQAGRNCICG